MIDNMKDSMTKQREKKNLCGLKQVIVISPANLKGENFVKKQYPSSQHLLTQSDVNDIVLVFFC